MSDSEIYLNTTLNQIPRLISLLNRNPLSSTYGCFDRSFWHYNTSDFACARSQEAVLTLALLYKISHAQNLYYKNSLILDWINAGLLFWGSIQESNGTFNEWYPKENSFVATAFSSYAISETLLQLGDMVQDRDGIIFHLKKAVDWLGKIDENRAQNQEAGAAIASYNLYLLTKETKYKYLSEDKINFIINNQTTEGWFYEYGGADIGYLSLCIDYLAKYYSKYRGTNLLKVLENAVKFISYFVHPDCTFGGGYGSRNTEYLIPHGFELLSDMYPDARVISSHIREALRNKSSVFPNSVDDRYLSYILYTYLQAYIDSRKIRDDGVPRYDQEFTRDFINSGIWIYSDDEFYLITNYKMGCPFVLSFKRNQYSIYDSGVQVKTKNEGNLISSHLSSRNVSHVSESCINVSGYMHKIKDNLVNPEKIILLRLFGLTVGRYDTIGLILKDKLRDKLITGSNSTNATFRREISINEHIVEIKDDICMREDIDELIIGSKASYIYVPSSRYFQKSELDSHQIVYNDFNNTDQDTISVTRIYNRTGELLNRQIKCNTG